MDYQKACLARLKELVKEKFILVRTSFDGDESELGYKPERTQARVIGLKEWAERITKYVTDMDIKSLPENLSAACQWGSREEYWAYEEIRSVKEYRRENFRKKTERMNFIANQFAEMCGEKVGSLRYVKKLLAAIRRLRRDCERWSSREYRYEHFAAHYVSGAGDMYWTNRNYEREMAYTNKQNFEELWEYIETEFPMTIMRYRELILKKGNK